MPDPVQFEERSVPGVDSHVDLRDAFAVRSIVGMSNLLHHTAAAGVAVMCLATVYDVLARYLFNSPTYWATEISTYVLIATTFFGASRTHLADGHVRVEMLLSRLHGQARRNALLVAAWIAFLVTFLLAWQTWLMVAADYRHGSRIFSLLLTPTWLPKLPIAIGASALAAVILVEIDRLTSRQAAWRRQSLYWIFLFVALLLAALGNDLSAQWPTRFDSGSLIVLVSVWLGAWINGGMRLMVYLVAAIAGASCVLYFGQQYGPGFTSIVLGLAILIALAAGVRIAFALIAIGVLAIYFVTPVPFPISMADRAWSSVNSFALTAIPMFVLMGAVVVRSGMSRELFAVMSKLLARLPGGLAHAAMLGCGLFAAVSGSSVATAATIGSVACPEMSRRRYSIGLSYGSVAAGGTLGILIPPSVPMIIYGTSVGVPVATLFIAGIVPGLLMIALFALTIVLWVGRQPGAAPSVSEDQLERITASSLVDTALLLLLVVMIVATLYLGIATPSETGAAGAFLAFLFCVFRGRLTWEGMKAALNETVGVTSFILLIVVGAGILTFGFDYLKAAQALMQVATGADVNRWVVMVIIMLVYLVLGMFLDSISMLVLTLPVVFPLVTSLNFDPVWFGIILVVMAEIGLITPPVGMNLFVLQGIVKGVPMRPIALGAFPFVIAMLVAVALMCVFPQIVLWATSGGA